MILLLILQTALVGGLDGKPLPPVAEPNWETWKDQSDPAIRPKMIKAWQVLSEHRSEKEYPTNDELRNAQAKVSESYTAIDAHPLTACAVGAELIKNTTDDWQRLMIASTLADLDGKKGRPFLQWAMATSKSVDETFEPAFETAYKMAGTRNPDFLPAMFLMLYAREGNIYLQLHSWFIPTQDCMFYVLGRYGRDVIPYLYPMLKKDDPYVRRNAAFVLGYFMDKQSVPALLNMLDTNDVGSGGAAFALGQLGHMDAAPRIARLLKNDDARTRFWATYALYELESPAALPELETAMKVEKDENTRKEMEVTIEHLRAGGTPENPDVKKLTKPQLQAALELALSKNGLEGDLEGIAATAGVEELAILEEIRLKCMKIPSDMGHKGFRQWSHVIKTVYRRCE